MSSVAGQRARGPIAAVQAPPSEPGSEPTPKQKLTLPLVPKRIRRVIIRLLPPDLQEDKFTELVKDWTVPEKCVSYYFVPGHVPKTSSKEPTYSRAYLTLASSELVAAFVAFVHPKLSSQFPSTRPPSVEYAPFQRVFKAPKLDKLAGKIGTTDEFKTFLAELRGEIPPSVPETSDVKSSSDSKSDGRSAKDKKSGRKEREKREKAGKKTPLTPDEASKKEKTKDKRENNKEKVEKRDVAKKKKDEEKQAKKETKEKGRQVKEEKKKDTRRGPSEGAPRSETGKVRIVTRPKTDAEDGPNGPSATDVSGDKQTPKPKRKQKPQSERDENVGSLRDDPKRLPTEALVLKESTKAAQSRGTIKPNESSLESGVNDAKPKTVRTRRRRRKGEDEVGPASSTDSGPLPGANSG